MAVVHITKGIVIFIAVFGVEIEIKLVYVVKGFLLCGVQWELVKIIPVKAERGTPAKFYCEVIFFGFVQVVDAVDVAVGFFHWLLVDC